MVRALAAVGLAAILGLPAAGQSASGVPAPNAAKLQWWRDARFGMFIHWGPVSIKGTEIGWSRGADVPQAEYDALYKQFNPTGFNADEWVRIAKAAGMKYMVFTTKHHDGFCMFDTKQTDHNIMGSPFKRDVVKELAEACRKGGLAFGTYHSVCDWRHPDFPYGSPGGSTNKPNPSLDRYEVYLRNQVSELINNYGPLLVMWFDVPQGFSPERGKRVVDFTRMLQPDILVNNRSSVPADFDTPEQTIGAYQDSRPWETCMTICNQWAWKPGDAMKPLSQCLQTLVKCAGGDGNLLFNVGPMPTGEIEARQVKRLAEMGRWLGSFGKTVYATRGGPYRPGAWGASTRRDKTIYLHLMKWADGSATLPALPARVRGWTVVTGGSAHVKQTAEGLRITAPRSTRRAIDTIIALHLDRPAAAIKPITVAGALSANGRASASNVYQNMDEYAAEAAIDDNPASRWATDAGTHSAWLQVDLTKPRTVGKVRILQQALYAERIRRFELLARDTGEWTTVATGTTMPAEYVAAFPAVTARSIKLSILEATDGPTIDELQVLPP
ncbi:MAG: alpha-L-fucosidase [Armatimonadetes bacterium]|nr:alpha-L-fucosidase [Armatimonadota bacterium]